MPRRFPHANCGRSFIASQVLYRPGEEARCAFAYARASSDCWTRRSDARVFHFMGALGGGDALCSADGSSNGSGTDEDVFGI